MQHNNCHALQKRHENLIYCPDVYLLLQMTDMQQCLAQELSLTPTQVQGAIALLDDGNTIPFITRYRKEATGGMDELQLRALAERLSYLRALEARRDEIKRFLEQSEQLTPELLQQLEAAQNLQTLEDLYLPFRPKRRTRAQIAREQGLQALADLLLAPTPERRGRAEAAAPFVSESNGVPDIESALAGARDIVAETVAETAALRQAIRDISRRSGTITVTRKADAADTEGKYRDYYDFRGPVASLPPHRILAINRAEHEEAVQVTIETDHDIAIALLQRRTITTSDWRSDQLRSAIADGYKRLLAPAIERDLRNELSERAEAHALSLFATNLRGLLLQPPLRGQIVLGIDPGFRTGCKLAVVDPTGKYLEGGVLYLHQADVAMQRLLALIKGHSVQVIAIGNGTASRETEALVAAALRQVDKLRYTIVSEAGASVYSASEVARQEYPELDATQRGTISIARRLQDPLAELVKIDPKALGVGMYQHDVNQKQLGEQLSTVVESCVNYVGVDLNTASAALLTYVAGVGPKVATAIVAHRDQQGPFNNRALLRKVKGLGPKTFEQCAGFLRIPDADDPLDQTAIHPESYAAARILIKRYGTAGQPLSAIATHIGQQLQAGSLTLTALAQELAIGEPTLTDILEAIERPGRDPRDEAPPPLLRADVLKMEDLTPGMQLRGTVRNVVDFGAFVDIGVKQDGLIHISELADRFVRSPLDVVQVGDIVDVRVVSVDLQRGRIALSMRGM